MIKNNLTCVKKNIFIIKNIFSFIVLTINLLFFYLFLFFYDNRIYYVKNFTFLYLNTYTKISSIFK